MVSTLTFSDGPEISLIQNRLTVATASLTALFFSGMFSLALFRISHGDSSGDYRSEFAHIEASLAIGVIAGLFAITCFLICQHVSHSTARWWPSRRWWFSLGQLYLYMALAMSLSAGLTEVVYGVARLHEVAALGIALAALPVWLLLLLGAPIHFLRTSCSAHIRWERKSLVLAFSMILIIVMSINAEVYRARSNQAFTWAGFLYELAAQFVQPLTWCQPWQ